MPAQAESRAWIPTACMRSHTFGHNAVAVRLHLLTGPSHKHNTVTGQLITCAVSVELTTFNTKFPSTGLLSLGPVANIHVMCLWWQSVLLRHRGRQIPQAASGSSTSKRKVMYKVQAACCNKRRLACGCTLPIAFLGRSMQLASRLHLQ